MEGDDESLDGLLGEVNMFLKVEIDVKDQRDEGSLTETKEDQNGVEEWTGEG